MSDAIITRQQPQKEKSDSFSVSRAQRSSRAKWGSAFGPSFTGEGHLALVYFAGCEGLKGLCGEVGTPLWKVGCVGGGAGDLDRLLCQRMEQLGSVNYGAIRRCECVSWTQTGFDDWHPRPIARPPHLDERLTLHSHGIKVRLRPSLTFSQLEARLRAALDDVALHRREGFRRGELHARWSRTPAGFVQATEIFSLNPRLKADIGRICDILSGLLA